MNKEVTELTVDGDEMNLPDIMKKHRARLKMTQADLARSTGMSLSTIKQYETGRNEPTVSKMQVIISALGLTQDDVWNSTGAGDVSDERLQMTVLSEATAFITGNPSKKDLLILRDQISKLGGEVEETFPDTPQTALQQLDEVIQKRGFSSRKLPSAVEAALAELRSLELDELDDLIDHYGVDYSVVDETDEQAEMAVLRILLAVLYEADLFTMGPEILEQMRVFATDADRKVEKQDNGFFGNDESDVDYMNRLIETLPPILVDLAHKKKFFEKPTV